MERRAIRVRIPRFDPGRDAGPHIETYGVEVDSRMSVLDVLEEIRQGQDASLTFRRSCRSGICGSCAVRVNGLAKLACKTRAAAEAEGHGEVLVEPMGNMPVIRDLVVDMAGFWREIHRATPWLVWDRALEASTRETPLTNEQQRLPGRLADCIMCGACFSDCVSRLFDERFTGPASLAKVHRFVADPRDGAGAERIRGLPGMGLWSCTRCYFCWSQCPRDVRPLEAITALRALSLRAGDRGRGSRHVEAFLDSVEESGLLNEAKLYWRTMGLGVIRDMPLALRMLAKGKAPPLLPRAIPKVDEVRTLYRVARGGGSR